MNNKPCRAYDDIPSVAATEVSLNGNVETCRRFMDERRSAYTKMIGLWCALIAFSVIDMAMSFIFFSKINEDGVGALSGIKYYATWAEAALGLVGVFILKTALDKLPREVRTLVVILSAVAFGIFVLHFGASQTILITRTALEQHFSSDSSNSPAAQIQAFTKGTSLPAATAQTGSLPPLKTENADKIGQDSFAENMNFFGWAFFLASMASAISFSQVKRQHAILGLRRIGRDFLRRHASLQEKQKRLSVVLTECASIRNSELLLVRACEDLVVAKFLDGLGYPKHWVAQMVMFADRNKESSAFRFLQIYRFRWILFTRVEPTQEMIEKCDAAVANLILTEPAGQSGQKCHMPREHQTFEVPDAPMYDDSISAAPPQSTLLNAPRR
jgi:hypothetical protein